MLRPYGDPLGFPNSVLICSGPLLRVTFVFLFSGCDGVVLLSVWLTFLLWLSILQFLNTRWVMATHWLC